MLAQTQTLVQRLTFLKLPAQACASPPWPQRRSLRIISFTYYLPAICMVLKQAPDATTACS